MRVLAAVLFLGLVLAGCADERQAPEPASEPAPLPAPRSNNPSNLIGLQAVNATAWPGEGPSTTAWKAECVRQWTSGAFNYYNPPTAQDKDCLFLPTDGGTIHFNRAASSLTYSATAPAAVVARPDGFFDWVALAGDGRDVLYLENGTQQGVVLARLDIQDPERARIGAVRLDEGSTHVVVADRGTAGQSQATVLLHHVWFTTPGDAESETIAGSPLGLSELALASDGQFVVAAATGIGVGTLAVSAGGRFSVSQVPSTQLFAVDILGGHAVACASVGSTYTLFEADLGLEGLLLWVPSVITASLGAAVAFDCPVAITSKGVTVVVDTPPLDGGGPNPLAGAIAYTRRTGEVTWTGASTGTTFWSEQALFNVGDLLVFYANNGQGTASGNENNGTVLWTPTTGDPTGDWHAFWGNFGRSVEPVQDKTRILLAGETWANRPFRYPWFNDNASDDGLLTWGVVDVPLPAMA